MWHQSTGLKMSSNYTRSSLLVICAVLAGCTAQSHQKAVQDSTDERLTLGTVQREIVIGMAASDVAETLGSPNIVTTDQDRREVWIYDKLATEVSYSRSSAGVAGLLIGGSGGIGAAGQAGSGASSSSQRTLMVIIKFDKGNLVRDFSFRASRY